MFSFFLCSFSHICYPHLLICRDISQAPAAARIAGKDNIWVAAANGDLALVKDHLVLQPALLDQGDSTFGFDP